MVHAGCCAVALMVALSVPAGTHARQTDTTAADSEFEDGATDGTEAADAEDEAEGAAGDDDPAEV